MKSTWLRALGLSCALSALALVTVSGCSKDNNVVTNNNCGDLEGVCPEGFAPVLLQEGSSIEECQMNGEGECKSVGSCTIRCEDPRGCTADGSVCSGDDKPACCGEAAGTHSCISFGDAPAVCAKRCTANADCPNSCCDATINNGTFAACAPYDVCVGAGGLPDDCRTCLETECPDDLAACMQDDVCAACASGEIYPQSPDCRNNPTLRRGYGCALQKCPGDCEM